MGLQLLHMLLGSDGPTGFSMPTFGPARCAKQQYNSNGQLTYLIKLKTRTLNQPNETRRYTIHPQKWLGNNTAIDQVRMYMIEYQKQKNVDPYRKKIPGGKGTARVVSCYISPRPHRCSWDAWVWHKVTSVDQSQYYSIKIHWQETGQQHAACR